MSQRTLVKIAPKLYIREVSLNRVEGEDTWILRINEGVGIPANHTEVWLWLELLKTRAELALTKREIGNLNELLQAYKDEEL